MGAENVSTCLVKRVCLNGSRDQVLPSLHVRVCWAAHCSTQSKEVLRATVQEVFPRGLCLNVLTVLEAGGTLFHGRTAH